jgi:DNA-binding NarL/FixJ family response regulator
MTGAFNAKWSNFPAALTVGAQVLLIDADPLSLSELAGVLARVVDCAATNSADRALESIEAGAQFDALVCPMRMPGLSARDLQDRVARIDAPLARRFLVLVNSHAGLEDAEFVASGRALVLLRPVSRGRLILLVRALVAHAAHRRLELLDGFQGNTKELRTCADES